MEEENKPWEIKEKYNILLFGWRYCNNKPYDKPRGVCPLFWEGILGLILIVLSPGINLYSLVFSFKNNRTFLKEVYWGSDLGSLGRFILNIVCLFFYWVLVLLYAPNVENPLDLSSIPLDAWLYGWIIVLAIVAAFVGFIYLLVKGFEKLTKTKFRRSDTVYVATEAIKGKFSKMCPRITWK